MPYSYYQLDFQRIKDLLEWLLEPPHEFEDENNASASRSIQYALLIAWFYEARFRLIFSLSGEFVCDIYFRQGMTLINQN